MKFCRSIVEYCPYLYYDWIFISSRWHYYASIPTIWYRSRFECFKKLLPVACYQFHSEQVIFSFTRSILMSKDSFKLKIFRVEMQRRTQKKKMLPISKNRTTLSALDSNICGSSLPTGNRRYIFVYILFAKNEEISCFCEVERVVWWFGPWRYLIMNWWYSVGFGRDYLLMFRFSFHIT